MHLQIPATDTKSDKELHFMWLEITEKCNLSCSHCYAESSPLRSLQGNMSLSEWLRVIDEGVDLGVQAIQFIGGEPTIHQDFKKLLTHVAERNIKTIEVYTNGTRLDDDIVGCFKDLNVSVATSFYATTPETHDAVTQRGGSWKRTVDGIKRVVSKDIPIRVGFIETDINKNKFAETSEFLNGLGVTEIGFDKERKVGRGSKGKTSDHEDINQLCGQCWKSRICITASSNIYPCVFSRKTVIGNAKMGLKAAIEGVELYKFKNLMILDQENKIESACYPDQPCSPQVCGPQLNCQPNRFCTPDAQCQPHYRNESRYNDYSQSDL